jgi:hypothetical protein
MATLSSQLTDLSNKVATNCQSRGVKIVEATEAASRPLLLWAQYLKTTFATGTADCLLDGVLSGVREAAACIALGLVRPALNSMRLQMDLLLAWVFFKDHPVEWQRVQDTGDGYKLKNDLAKYYGDNNQRFTRRHAILRDTRTRQVEDPYRLLSAHMHGQSEYVVPRVDKPVDIVASVKLQDDAIVLQAETCEFLCDILWSLYADKWTSIPEQLRKPLMARFVSAEQRGEFFSKQ